MPEIAWWALERVNQGLDLSENGEVSECTLIAGLSIPRKEAEKRCREQDVRPNIPLR